MEGRGSKIALLAWAASLLLLPRGSGHGRVVDALLLLGWLAALLRSAAAGPRRKHLFALVSGGAALAIWKEEPAGYPLALALLVTSIACAGSGLLALVPALAPVPLLLFVWLAGGDAGRELIRHEWRPPSFTFVWWRDAARFAATVLAAWLGVKLAARDGSTAAARLARAAPWLAGAATTATFLARAWSIGSFFRVPADAGWSEPPLLLNLLRLRSGAEIYPPFGDCSGYLYAPTLELVHHVLLAPFALDLSLTANRLLVVAWDLAAAAVLLLCVRGDRLPKRFTVPGLILVAFSSFMTPKLHPDPLLLVWFALALGVAVHRERLPKRVILVGLALLPPLAVAVKMTGAGVGLGLALAFALPFDRRRFLALGAGAALSALVLASFEQAMPRFWAYTVRLPASQPIHWAALEVLPTEGAMRLLFVAVAALVVASVYRRGAWRDVAAPVLVASGFGLTSLLAYIKVGGRAHSLLPFAFVAALVLARVARELLKLERGGVALAAVLAGWAALTVTPPVEPVDTATARVAADREARAIALVGGERAAGRRTLYYGAVRAWIEAGERAIPRDTAQGANELAEARFPEAEAHLERLSSGYYESVIASDYMLSPEFSIVAERVGAILRRHYAPDPPPETAPGVSPRVWRWRGDE